MYFSVSGCPDLPPPDGAWMTRDGDVMEIGCHSGAKTWNLNCQANQWVGAIGQCGTGQGKKCCTFSKPVSLLKVFLKYFFSYCKL